MNTDRKLSQFGFTLLELMIVVAILIIIAAIAIPAARQTIANQQLASSGYSVASMLENTRLTAVKGNQPYYALYNSGLCVNFACAVPAAGSPNPPDGSNYAVSDGLAVTTSGSVSFNNAPPNHLQLDNYLGGAGVQVELNTPIGFNGRGMPCMASAATPFVCQQQDPAAGGIPAFEWFMESSMTRGWVAITVSPAGRIRSWRLVSRKNGACGFPACWE